LKNKASERNTKFAKISAAHIPRDTKQIAKMQDTMRSFNPPYPAFNNFYPIKEVTLNTNIKYWII